MFSTHVNREDFLARLKALGPFILPGQHGNSSRGSYILVSAPEQDDPADVTHLDLTASSEIGEAWAALPCTSYTEQAPDGEGDDPQHFGFFIEIARITALLSALTSEQVRIDYDPHRERAICLYPLRDNGSDIRNRRIDTTVVDYRIVDTDDDARYTTPDNLLTLTDGADFAHAITETAVAQTPNTPSIVKGIYLGYKVDEDHVTLTSLNGDTRFIRATSAISGKLHNDLLTRAPANIITTVSSTFSEHTIRIGEGNGQEFFCSVHRTDDTPVYEFSIEPLVDASDHGMADRLGQIEQSFSAITGLPTVDLELDVTELRAAMGTISKVGGTDSSWTSTKIITLTIDPKQGYATLSVNAESSVKAEVSCTTTLSDKCIVDAMYDDIKDLVLRGHSSGDTVSLRLAMRTDGQPCAILVGDANADHQAMIGIQAST